MLVKDFTKTQIVISTASMRTVGAQSGGSKRRAMWNQPLLLVKERSISVQGAMVFTALMRLKERRSGTIHLSMWICRRRCGRGKVYFGTGYGEYRIYAVDANSGAEVWSKRVDYPAWGSPSADGDTVFFGLGNGNFIESAEVPQGRVSAHNAETGEQMWQYETEDSVLTAVAYRNGFVYFGSRDGGVYALNATDGALGWKADIGHAVVSSPAVTENAVYVGADNGVIYKIDIGSGHVVWQFDTEKITGGMPIYSSPAIANGKLYIGLKHFLLCLGGEGTMEEMLELDDQ